MSRSAPAPKPGALSTPVVAGAIVVVLAVIGLAYWLLIGRSTVVAPPRSTTAPSSTPVVVTTPGDKTATGPVQPGADDGAR